MRKKEYIDKIIQYVNEIMKYDLSLDEISERIGLTKSYISKLFKASKLPLHRLCHQAEDGGRRNAC